MFGIKIRLFVLDVTVILMRIYAILPKTLFNLGRTGRLSSNKHGLAMPFYVHVQKSVRISFENRVSKYYISDVLGNIHGLFAIR